MEKQLIHAFSIEKKKIVDLGVLFLPLLCMKVLVCQIL